MLYGEALIGGQFFGGPCDGSLPKSVIKNPYNGQVVGSAAEGDYRGYVNAIEAANEAYPSWSIDAGRRKQVLETVSKTITERRQELADLLVAEIGKHKVLALGEIDRAALTFKLAADLVDIYPFYEKLDINYDRRSAGVEASCERRARGVIFGIVPYNWPINLAAHKIAPALAAGNSVVIKPSPLSPISTYELCKLVHQAGCPDGAINCVLGSNADTEKALEHEKVAMVSFTGSPKVGWHLKQLLWRKPVTLELGGAATAIVGPDVDINDTVAKLVAGGYSYSGQTCISVQNILVHEEIYKEFEAKFVEAARAFGYGDPSDEVVKCGPMISVEAASRIWQRVQQAVEAGAILLLGEEPEGNSMAPAVVANVQPGSDLFNTEIFGPVVTIGSVPDFGEAFDAVNGLGGSIHTAIFTHDEVVWSQAKAALNAGGLLRNITPSTRFDSMPYGGTGNSGFGREGVRYAMDEMTEYRSLLEQP